MPLSSALDETRITEWYNLLRDLMEVAGGSEWSSLFPAAEVVDAAPADLPAGYIRVVGRSGAYEPALKIPGAGYVVGDTVILLYVRGTEAIALTQAPSSSGSTLSGHIIQDEGVSRPNEAKLNFIGAGVTATDNPGTGATDVTIPGASGYPFSVLTVDPTDPDADYSTISAAVADAVAGDWIEIGPGTYSEDVTAASINFIAKGDAIIDGDMNVSGTCTLIGLMWKDTDDVLTTAAGGTYVLVGLRDAVLDASGTVKIYWGHYRNGITYPTADINVTKDTYLTPESGNNNYGGATTFVVGTVSSNVRHGLVYASLSSISTTITSAKLRLYNNGTGTGSDEMRVYRITAADANWPEGTANGASQVGSCCWNKHTYNTVSWAGAAGLINPTDYTIPAVGALTIDGTVAGWCEITLDAAVIEAMRTGSNEGFVLILKWEGGVDTYINFQSREGTPNDPILRVTYTSGISAIVVQAGATVTLNNLPTVESITATGTLTGEYSDSSRNLIVSGASLAIKGVGSNTPDIGSTTAAEKWGHIYLALAKDVYPDNDAFGIWSRQINVGLNPIEHWHQAADDAAWTGWSGWVGYSTPPSIARTNSVLRAYSGAGAIESFYYRSAVTTANIFLHTRCTPLYNAASGTVRTGIMLTGSTDKGDGSGPNDYYRVMVEATAPNTNLVLRREYRVGGGAAAAAVTAFSYPPSVVPVIELIAAGTRWTSYAIGAYWVGELSSGVIQYDGGPFTFTPAYVGLYHYASAANLWGVWDWYNSA